MTTPPLSHAAQAVLDAFCASEGGVYLEGDPERIAAALRAVAAQFADYDPPRTAFYPEAQALVDGKCIRNSVIYAEIINIANELDQP
jgi:hypothetical protein